MSPRSAKPPLAIAIADAIRKVPRGRVSTYGAIAKAAGYPRCSRHVARVLNQVPGLPWQRILGAGGRISLPRERGLEQRFLLETEEVRFRGRKVDLAQYEYVFRHTRSTAKKTAQKAPSKRRRSRA